MGLLWLLFNFFSRSHCGETVHAAEVESLSLYMFSDWAAFHLDLCATDQPIAARDAQACTAEGSSSSSAQLLLCSFRKQLSLL